MKYVALITLLASVLAAPAAIAANAKHPHSHVNHKNDAGNPTGDAETAKLNQQQLQQHANGQ